MTSVKKDKAICVITNTFAIPETGTISPNPTVKKVTTLKYSEFNIVISPINDA